MAITDNNYAQSVDHLVNNMPKPDPPFDTKAYANYKAQVDKYRQTISNDELSETIYKLGFKLDQTLDQIISRLDYIIGGESDGN